MIIVTESAGLAQDLHRKNCSSRLGTSLCPPHGPDLYHAPRADELLAGGRMHRLGNLSSRATHSLSGAAALAARRLQRAACGRALLEMETGKGKFFFLIDATLSSQSGRKTQNTHSTGNRKRRPQKGRRYNKKKVTPQTMPQLYVWLADHAVGISHPLADPALHQRVLRREGAATSHDRRSGRRYDSQLAVARRGRRGRAGRYGLRCEGRATRPARSEDTSGSLRPTRSAFTKDRRANARKCVLV